MFDAFLSISIKSTDFIFLKFNNWLWIGLFELISDNLGWMVLVFSFFNDSNIYSLIWFLHLNRWDISNGTNY